jgi:hypothetical protein
METSKPWSVSASLRGFYDDNYAMRNSHLVSPVTGEKLKRDSIGFEVSPALNLNFSLEQTLISLGYRYGLRWYEDRKNNSADHTHQFDLKIDHAFAERYKLTLTDSFVVAQEPTLLEPTGPVSIPLRTDGNNVRNNAAAVFNAELTRVLSGVLSYGNNIYDYQESGAGSRSPILDRMEHMITANLRWQAMPTTVGILGYQFGIINHTSNDSLDVFTFVDPEVRDSQNHFVYLGADHTFTSTLMGSARVGAEFVDYVNHLPGGTKSSVSPYADASLSWNYMTGSSLQLGVRHARNQTDVAFLGGTNPTLDQESTTAYLTVGHAITAKLKANGLAQYQYSTFKGGLADSSSDNYFVGGVSLSYQINQWLSAETGWSFDRLDSDLSGRSFTRNRVFMGVRAVY